MKVKIKKLVPEAILPKYATVGDAGMDLFALEGVSLKPGERIKVKTGIAIEIPLGYVGLVWDKSGVSTQYGIKTLAGVIDSGYRGEIQIGIVNLSLEDYVLHQGEKIAQMLIQTVERPELEEVEENLSGSERGEGGFGSTGKN